ncbi:hypothetical protein T4B_5562 [Trichinella pseudospiralis]|uniref:Uncharacterized protein n=1 Tax=Trichinella pseudospiralis TaxID=6337 RepID=A0A0V1GB78_TRIPS|nr:hypothetical protein T4B_5562 [Trichinella pseudospiralis]
MIWFRHLSRIVFEALPKFVRLQHATDAYVHLE